MATSYLDGLRALEPELVKQAVGGVRFQQCFFDNPQDAKVRAFVTGVLSKAETALA